MVLLFLSLYIQVFDSEIKLYQDGSLDIREKITVNYDGGYHHGIYRDIPLELKGISGNFSLGFKVHKVLMDGKDVSGIFNNAVIVLSKRSDLQKLQNGIKIYHLKTDGAFYKKW